MCRRLRLGRRRRGADEFGGSVDAFGGGITMGMLLSLPMAIVGATAIALALRGVTRPRLPKAVEASSA